MLISCGSGGEESYPEFTYADGKITSEDGASYTPAPMGFQPCNAGKKCAVRDKYFDLYQLLDLDGKAIPKEDWLTEEYAGNATSVYYGDGIELPDFTEIAFSRCYVCEEDETVSFVSDTDDRALIGSLIDRIANGKDSTGRLDDSKYTYTLKFYSEDYPGIFFSVDYIVYDDGAAYLYSICNKKWAEATGMLDGLIELPEDTAN